MREAAALLALVLLLGGTRAWAAEPIPQDKRIAAEVVRTIGSPDDQPMHMPTDVAADGRGVVYVADGANGRVMKFAADGRFEEVISDVGSQKLVRPVGLTVDKSDQLWIADPGAKGLFVLDGDGKLVSGIVPLQIDKLGPVECTGVAVTPDGKRTYVVDNKNHRVLVRDNQSRKWTALGTSGRALGQFQWPFMICVGAENYAYVTEAIGARVQMISPTDRWAGEVGKWGVELGQLYRPKGICADSAGRVFVGDSTLGVVQVFSPRGVAAGVLCGKDGNPLRFAHPMGMCLDGKGMLYVVELKANRVAVVKVEGQSK